MYADLRLSYATVILQKKIFVVYWCWSKKMRRSWYWVDMLICILSSSHYFIAKSKASFFVFAFKICLRHQSVTPCLGGASPSKKNPELTNLYFFKGAVITTSYNSSFGQWPVLSLWNLRNCLWITKPQLRVKLICLPRHYFKRFKQQNWALKNC